jgi:hypothetical protein
MWREHAVVEEQVDLGPGRQCGQLREELEGLEDEVRGPIAPGPLQLDRHPPIRLEPQPILDQWGGADTGTDGPGAIVGRHPHGGRG